MSASMLDRPVRRDLLEEFSRPALVRLLAPHAEALAAFGLDVASLDPPILPPPDEDSALARLYELASQAGALPEPLAQALADLGDVATLSGHDELLRVAAERGAALVR